MTGTRLDGSPLEPEDPHARERSCAEQRDERERDAAVRRCRRGDARDSRRRVHMAGEQRRSCGSVVAEGNAFLSLC